VGADFGFVNARVRGLRSRLLPSAFVGEQVASEGFGAFVGALGQSAYSRDLEEARAAHGELAAVDVAIASNFVRATQTLLRAADGDAKKLIELLLRRYDLANLKAVVRGLYRKQAPEAIEAALLPAGPLDAGSLRAMVQRGDLAGAGQVLAVAGHPLAEPFRKLVAAFAESGDTLAFEVGLDEAFYADWLAAAERVGAPQPFRAFVALEIDATNLRTAMKLRGRDGALGRFFVSGGAALRARVFNAIAEQESGAALGKLTGALAPLSDAAPAAVERRLMALLDRAAERLARDPLSVGLVADYLRRKERESAQLRLLARGRYYGVPRSDLERELSDA
jgi:V/A-type H+-transporting ATPase subunit C